MRELTSHKVNGLNDEIAIEVMDEPGDGGANHVYDIVYPVTGSVAIRQVIRFQNGPIQEAGVNGISNEALLAIVEDRLRGFHEGDYRTPEGTMALQKVEEAMMWLHKRTRDRVARGVEGTHEK